MRIAMIGAGNVGSALGRAWLGGGEDVIFGVPNPADPKYRSLPEEKMRTAPEAARGAEIIVLATPWPATETAVKSLGDLSGKIVIDCMNPIGMTGGALGLLLGHSTSGGETVATWLPGAHVVKTLNQVGAEMMADNAGLPHRPVMFMAGDDAQAKAKVAAVLSDLGFEPLDAGDIARSRLLEPFGMVWINQALLRGKGRNWAFAAVERK